MISFAFYVSLPPIIFLIGWFLRFKNNVKKTNLFQIIIFIAILSFVIGFRSVSVGNDTLSYYDAYNAMKGIGFNEAMRVSHFEKGYLAVTYIFANLNIPFILFNFLVSLLLAIPLVISCFMLSKQPHLSISIYVCSGCFTLNMSSVRQTLAMALCFCTILFLSMCRDKPNNYKKILSLIPCFSAIFIHKSCALFFLVAPCMLIKAKKEYLIYFLIFSGIFILFMPSLISPIIFSIMKPDEIYSFFPPRSSLSFSGTALMIFIIIILYFIFYSDNSRKIDLSLRKIPLLEKLNNISFSNCSNYSNDNIVIGMVFFQFLMYLSEQAVSLLARAGLYGGLGLCIFVPNLIHKLAKEEKVNPIVFVGILLFFVAYFIFTTLKDNYLGLMPYGVFNV